ncbi:DUF2157 domain-containing protein [Litoribacillus peritrichatus]
MEDTRSTLIELIEQGKVSPEHVDGAIAELSVFPSKLAWRSFIDLFLLWLGSLALAFSVMFFIAYNWSELDRFSKFALVEASMVVAMLVFLKQPLHNRVGQSALFVCAILLGVLMALFGQTYQTGADPWELFFNWALLMLLWALVGRFPALWVLWCSLVNLSIVLYFESMRSLLWSVFDDFYLWFSVFAFNLAVMVVWELASNKLEWLNARWAVRLIATGCGVSVTLMAVDAIATTSQFEWLVAVVWCLWVAVMYYAYRIYRPDLFMLAGSCLSGTIVVVALMIEYVFTRDTAASFLLMSFIIIGLGSGSALWLRNVHREWLVAENGEGGLDNDK